MNLRLLACSLAVSAGIHGAFIVALSGGQGEQPAEVKVLPVEIVSLPERPKEEKAEPEPAKPTPGRIVARKAAAAAPSSQLEAIDSPVSSPEAIARAPGVEAQGCCPRAVQAGEVARLGPVAVEEKADGTRAAEAVGAYLAEVRNLIEKTKSYPRAARKRGFEGAVRLSFTISKDGRASDAAVVKSSGYAALDEGAIETVERASPFPPIPEAAGRETINAEVDVVYRLMD